MRRLGRVKAEAALVVALSREVIVDAARNDGVITSSADVTGSHVIPATDDVNKKSVENHANCEEERQN